MTFDAVHVAIGTNIRKQRTFAAVSETLLDIYAEDGMSLEPLMAFTVMNG